MRILSGEKGFFRTIISYLVIPVFFAGGTIHFSANHCIAYEDAKINMIQGRQEVLKIKHPTQEKIRRGECIFSWKKVALYVTIGVVALIILVLFLARWRGRREEAISPEVSRVIGEAAVVEKPEEILIPLGALVGKEGPLKGEIFEISKEGLKIGRDPKRCEVVIKSPHVSREHAWVGEEKDKILIKDLDSEEGTFLNILSHQVRSEVLRPGDVIIIGSRKAASFIFKRFED